MILSSNEVAKQFNFNKAVIYRKITENLMHVIAAKAVCFKEAVQQEYKEYQQNIVKNAKALCEGFKEEASICVRGN